MPEESEKSFKEEVLVMAKARGLDAAENMAGELAELALDVLGLVIAKSPNKFDDMAWTALEKKAREVVAEAIDKIDGEVG